MPNRDLVTAWLQAAWRHLSRPLPLAPQRLVPSSHLVTYLLSRARTPDAPCARLARVPHGPCPGGSYGSVACPASASDWPSYWPLGRQVFDSTADGDRCGSRAGITPRSSGIYDVAFASSPYNGKSTRIVTPNHRITAGLDASITQGRRCDRSLQPEENQPRRRSIFKPPISLQFHSGVGTNLPFAVSAANMW